MKSIYLLILFLFISKSTDAQEMLLHNNNGRDTSFPVTMIDSITFSNTPYVQDSVLFYDDFEFYPGNSFPVYGGWALFELSDSVLKAGAKVDSKNRYSGMKSLRVFSTGTDKIMVNRHLSRTPKIVYMDFRLYIQKLAVDVGKAASLEIGLWNIADGEFGSNYAGYVMKENGAFSCKAGNKEALIDNFVTGRWYRLRLKYSVDDKSIQVWMNGIAVVPKFTGLMPYLGYNDFSIVSQNNEVLLDEIKIWESN